MINEGPASGRGVVVFAHGARAPQWENSVRAYADLLARDLSPDHVIVAFLQFGEPKLPEAIASLIDRGANRIIVLPFFLATGGHLLRDLPELVEKIRCDHPRVDIRLAPVLGEDPGVVRALRRAGKDFVRDVFCEGREKQPSKTEEL